MSGEIQDAIECWASQPTWFSSHPMDVSELRGAVANLKQLGFVPTEEELTEVIYCRVKGLPEMPGTPKDVKSAAREFAIKIRKKLLK